MTEVPPLFVIEFLHRVVDTFEDYFSECSESVIKDNYVVVYEVLDEMLDNGFPLATEANILKELIKPPNMLRDVVNSVTGKSQKSRNPGKWPEILKPRQVERERGAADRPAVQHPLAPGRRQVHQQRGLL
jgi:hypothetical protein